LPATKPAKSPQATAIKRLPLMRRIQVYSPKASRMLVLFSYECVSAWSLAESSPLVEAFCEYPGFIPAGGARVMADLWLRGAGREQLIKIDGGIEVSPELPRQVPTYVDIEVSIIKRDWLTQHQVWIDNWLQINPYLVANARFVTPAMLDKVNALFDDARPLFDAEHAMRDVDPQLVRTAIFMLMHQGRLYSHDLRVQALATTTVFQRGAERTAASPSWLA
jgi:hypothetical protein